jgi:hypothetical protein
MPTTRALSVVAASSLLALIILSPAYAESPAAKEQRDLGNPSSMDVDPGASKGQDKPIITQERMQINNSGGPNVPSSSEKGGESIPKIEQKDLR